MRKLLAGLMLTLLLLPLASAIPLTHALQVVSTWELDRPSKTVEFYESERVENASTNDEASVGVGVHITAYRENCSSTPFYGRDGVEIRVAATTNTRKGIQYSHTDCGRLTNGFPDSNGMLPTNITDDDSGKWLDLPFGVYFYGGPGCQNKSACYNRVWICSNGFLSFTSNSNSSSPKAIPNPEEPNTIIAPFWTDLDPSGGSISYQYSWLIPPKFFIVWDHVLNKRNNARETFAVIISSEWTHGIVVRGQNNIIFLYKNVSGDPNAVIGLEDQEGYKGYTPLDPTNYPHGEDELWLYSERDSPEIRKIKIKAWKSDGCAEIWMGGNDPRGHNMQWKATTEAPQPIYEVALMGGATLLFNELCGLCWDVTELQFDLLAAYAKSSWPSFFYDSHNASVNDSWGYINASAAYSSGIDWPVDASFFDNIYWVFTDSNTEEHSIKIYAEVEYYSYKYGRTMTISTSASLRMIHDICNDFSNPRLLGVGQYKGCLDNIDTVDMYKIYVELNKQIDLTMWPFRDANYDLYLYNPSQVKVASSKNAGNLTESMTYSTNSSGYWYIKVKNEYWENHTSEGIYRLKIGVNSLRVKTYVVGGSEIAGVKIWIDSDPVRYSPVMVAIGGSHTVRVESEFVRGSFEYTFLHWEDNSTNNLRTVLVSSDMTIIAYYYVEYIGTCPTLFVWNGTDYTYETLLNIHAESDITLQHRITQPLVKDGAFYKLSLRELDEFTSHIDQVKLYAVDTNEKTHLCKLTRAVHNRLGNVRTLLLSDDSNRVDLYPTQTINLEFTLPCFNGNIAYFTFEINGHNRKGE